MDPYNSFKDDVERRRALNTKAWCGFFSVVAVCNSGASFEQVMQWMQVIKVLFH